MESREIHRQKIFSLSEKAPIVIECIVSSDHLKKFLSGLKKIIKEGALFTTPVHLILSK